MRWWKGLLALLGAAAFVAFFESTAATFFLSWVAHKLYVDVEAWSLLIGINAFLVGLAMVAGKFAETPDPEAPDWNDLIAATATEIIILSFGVVAQLGMRLFEIHYDLAHKKTLERDDSPLAAFIYQCYGEGADALLRYMILVGTAFGVSLLLLVVVAGWAIFKGRGDRAAWFIASPLSLFLFTADTLILHPWLGNHPQHRSPEICAALGRMFWSLLPVCAGVTAVLIVAGLSVRLLAGWIAIMARSPKRRGETLTVLAWIAAAALGAAIVALVVLFLCWFCLRPPETPRPAPPPPPPCVCCCCPCPEPCPREPPCEEPASCAPCESDARCESCAPPTR